MLYFYSLTLSLYSLSALFAIPYLYINEIDTGSIDVNIFSAFVFCFLFFIFIYPFISFREDLVRVLVLPNYRFLNNFSKFVCVLSLFAVGFFVPFTIIALNTPDISEARNAMVSLDEVIVDVGIFNTIAGTAASFYQIPIILFFIYHIIDGNKVFKYLLLVSSLSYVFFVFSAYGRDGIVFWILSFIGISGFFGPFLSRQFRKKIKFLVLFVAILGGAGFMIITFSRFEGGEIDAIISYIGQPIPNFFLAFEADAPISHGYDFPLFRSMLGLSEEADTSMQSYALENYGTYSWVFGTFLKSFILSFGFIGTILVSIVFYMLFKKLVATKDVAASGDFSLGSLLMYLLYFQIFYQGVFYYRQYNRVGNLLIIVYILLTIIFSMIIKNDDNKILIKKIEE